MQVLNFYSTIFADQLKRGRKTATIRLGDKSHKYKKNQAVLVSDKQLNAVLTYQVPAVFNPAARP